MLKTYGVFLCQEYSACDAPTLVQKRDVYALIIPSNKNIYGVRYYDNINNMICNIKDYIFKSRINLYSKEDIMEYDEDEYNELFGEDSDFGDYGVTPDGPYIEKNGGWIYFHRDIAELVDL